MASPFINTLTSFSGADLVVSFANQIIGELQQLSWAIQREKAPVFTLGSADARSFSRGKRAIAGSMSFAVFDNDALVSAMQRIWDQIAPPAMFTAAGNVALRGSEAFQDAMDISAWNVKAGEAATGNLATGATRWGQSGTGAITPGAIDGSNSRPTTIVNGVVTGWDNAAATDIYVPNGFAPIRGENVLYADTLPPFDITMTFANEYGQCAFQKIYDVDILNEGSGVSVDTVVMERQMTYVARRVSPLIKGVYSRDEGGTMKGMPVVK